LIYQCLTAFFKIGKINGEGKNFSENYLVFFITVWSMQYFVYYYANFEVWDSSKANRRIAVLVYSSILLNNSQYFYHF